MRILHYSLGLPPYRSGGLTKYATDLMLAQQDSGDQVSLLYPGDYTFWKIPKIKIIKNESFNGISVFEIKNSTIVPLLHGVRNPSDIFGQNRKLTDKVLDKFYNDVKPDVIHIHTLMGLPPELIIFLKDKNIRVVFTSHDYYGLCLKVNFINYQGVFCKSPGGIECAMCNQNVPNSLFLRLRNSKFLLKHKERFHSDSKGLIDKINNSSNVGIPSAKQSKEFATLIEFYNKLFKLIDCFHFNSNVSKSVYENYLNPKQSVVLPISHADIKDLRILKKFYGQHIHLGFIGSTSAYKGFPMLKAALLELNDLGVNNWSLQVWSDPADSDSECDKIIYKGKYSTAYLENIFNEMDLLIVPSIWKETFSLITLEAISHGVPVLVSTNVGAKDIIKMYNPEFIFHPSKEALKSMVHDILKNPSLLTEYNKKILISKFDYFLDDHIQKIKQLYTNLD